MDENSLAQSVSVLRRALEEKPGDNNYIVTLPGRGYQFVSTVQMISPENGNTGVEVSKSSGANGIASDLGAIPASLIPEENEQVSRPTAPNRLPWKLASVIGEAPIFAPGYFAWTRYHRVRPTTNPDSTENAADSELNIHAGRERDVRSGSSQNRYSPCPCRSLSLFKTRRACPKSGCQR